MLRSISTVVAVASYESYPGGATARDRDALDYKRGLGVVSFHGLLADAAVDLTEGLCCRRLRQVGGELRLIQDFPEEYIRDRAIL